MRRGQPPHTPPLSHVPLPLLKHTNTTTDSTPLLFLTDWYHTDADDLLEVYVSPDNPDGVEPVPDNALAQGIGQHYCGASCDVAVLRAGARTPGLAAGEEEDADAAGALCADVDTDLVLVNGAAFAPFYVSLHSPPGVPPVRAFMVAIDAVPIDPVDVSGAPVFIDVGQRVRLALCRTGGEETPAQRASPVFVLSEMADASFDAPSPFNSTLAVLDFRGGGRTGLKGWAEDVVESVHSADGGGAGALPWKVGSDRARLADLLAAPGLVPPAVAAAMTASATPRPPVPVMGDAKKAKQAAAAVPKHAHDRPETDPARAAARDCMRAGAFTPRTAAGPVFPLVAGSGFNSSSSSQPGRPGPSRSPPPGGGLSDGLTPPAPNKRLDFYVISNPNAQNESFFYLNGVSFQPPPYGPSLLERIFGNPERQNYTNAVPWVPANETLPAPSAVGWNVLDNDLGTVVDLVFTNGDEGEFCFLSFSFCFVGGGGWWFAQRWAAGARPGHLRPLTHTHSSHVRAPTTPNTHTHTHRAPPHPHARPLGVGHGLGVRHPGRPAAGGPGQPGCRRDGGRGGRHGRHGRHDARRCSESAPSRLVHGPRHGHPARRGFSRPALHRGQPVHLAGALPHRLAPVRGPGLCHAGRDLREMCRSAFFF
jgi:hypothetical protein